MIRSPVAVVMRWKEHGAIWRLRHTDTLAVIDLCTWHRGPVDELRSSDLELLRYRPRRLASPDKEE